MNRYDFGAVESARRRVAQVAQDVLAGHLDIFTAAQELSRLRHDVDVGEDDEDFLAFVLIDSETDHLPIAERVRPLWDATALREKDKDIARADAWAREFGIPACVNLVSRFGTA